MKRKNQMKSYSESMLRFRIRRQGSMMARDMPSCSLKLTSYACENEYVITVKNIPMVVGTGGGAHVKMKFTTNKQTCNKRPENVVILHQKTNISYSVSITQWVYGFVTMREFCCYRIHHRQTNV